MSKVGVIGLGKLGLPVAVAINSKGHDVWGYDIAPEPQQYLIDRQIPYQEADLQPLLDAHTVTVAGSVETVVREADIIFAPIQTPHDSRFEGVTRVPKDRQDFEYKYLVSAIATIAEAAQRLQKHVHLIVISTCLPGTFEERIAPVIAGNEYITYYYNPFFIAMGTVVKDFLNPEFVLLGADDKEKSKFIEEFYATLHDKPVFATDIKTAEGIKVFYNTFITTKTVLANTYGEMAHKLGMNVDDIFTALSMATDRLISPKYLQAGLADGGGCHPRDNIALSYIAKKINLSHNIFEDIMSAREDHMDWLARLTIDESNKSGLPLVILGRSFKPDTNIETGSAAILMANMITEDYGYPIKAHVQDMELTEPAVYFIGTKHERYTKYSFPAGSIVIDPFRFIDKHKHITVIPIGKMV